MDREGERAAGSASVEQVGLAALVALLLLPRSRPSPPVATSTPAARWPARSAGRSPAPRACPSPAPAPAGPRLRLAARPPRPGSRPGSVAERGTGGMPLVPVDFRRCRSQSCARRRRPPPDRLGTAYHGLHQVEDRRADLAGSRSPTGSTAPRSDGSGLSAARPMPTSTPPPAPASCSRTTRRWSRSRRCPAATTTSSPPTSGRRGSGACAAPTRAGRADQPLLHAAFDPVEDDLEAGLETLDRGTGAKRFRQAAELRVLGEVALGDEVLEVLGLARSPRREASAPGHNR